LIVIKDFVKDGADDMNAKKKDSPEEIERQLKRVHTLAARLPWIVVTITLISMIFILLEIYFRG